MITIRQNVFETNSSSCHSLTFFSKSLWKDFIDRKVFIRRSSFSDWEIHTTKFDTIDKDSKEYYLISANDYYKETVESIKTALSKPVSKYYSASDFEYAIMGYLKENISKELLQKILFGKSDDIIYNFKEPIVEDYGRYHSDNRDHTITYTGITVSDLYGCIYNQDRFDVEKVYIFGEDTWNKDQVKYWKVWVQDKNESVKEENEEEIILIDRELWD